MTLTEHLPHRRIEAWKWTDVRRAVREDAPGLRIAATPKFTPPEGVFVSQGEGHPSDTIMGRLAANFAGQSWNVYVPAGTQPIAPLLVEDMVQGHACMAMMIDKGASLTLIEYHRGTSGAFANIDLHIHLAEGAHLTRIIVQDDPEETVRISTACIAAEGGAKLDQFTLSFGGALTRLETRIYGEGEAVEALINGAYLLDGKRHADMTSHIDLKSPNCTIRQSVKGVVTERSRGVFQGKFHVHQAAQHTDAEMRHDALMLSDTSEVRAKPELEIYADDVACAHGNTIGQLDESALFYMRQRGIPISQARALLMEAFISSVFDDVEDDEMRDSLLGKIQDWLRRDT